MRITNNIIQQDLLTNLQRGLRQVAVAQQQVSRGIKLHKASDDPMAASSAMQRRSALRALEQHRTGIQAARSRLSLEESLLDQVGNLLVRAQELGVGLGGDASGSTDRAVAAAEADQLLRSAIELANYRYEDTYFFGGAQADVRPYEVTGSGAAIDFTATSPTGSLVIETAFNQRIPTNHSGREVFESSGVLEALRDLSRALHADDGAGIRDAISAARDAFREIQKLTADSVSRVNFIDVTASNLDALEINLKVLKSNAEEVDIEEAVMELMNRQAAYQAAMLATSRVMGLTLADYLR